MTDARGTLWITRAQPGAAATAERVAALGFKPHVAPLLEIRALADVEVDRTGVTALAFTSANAVRAFAELDPRRDLPAFVVGDATAAAAREAAFQVVASAAGDVSDLAGLVAEATGADDFVLHPSAVEPAGNLAEALRARGRRARAVAIYESAPISPRPAPDLDSLAGVLLHSPKAAVALHAMLGARSAPNLIAYCLSLAVARPLANLDLGGVACAPFPNEAALLTLLE